jgi:hypothetical protein
LGSLPKNFMVKKNCAEFRCSSPWHNQLEKNIRMIIKVVMLFEIQHVSRNQLTVVLSFNHAKNRTCESTRRKQMTIQCYVEMIE